MLTYATFQGLVRVVQTLDDNHLVLRGVDWADGHNGGERRDPQVLEVVVIRTKKPTDGPGSQLHQLLEAIRQVRTDW